MEQAGNNPADICSEPSRSLRLLRSAWFAYPKHGRREADPCVQKDEVFRWRSSVVHMRPKLSQAMQDRALAGE